MREIEQTPTVPAVKQVSSLTGKRRGRPANVQATARRAAELERVQVGEISNAEAGKELGITYAAWSGWKANQGQRAGVNVLAPREEGTRAKVVEPAPAEPTSDRSELIARLEVLERFAVELRRRVRELVAFVEANV